MRRGALIKYRAECGHTVDCYALEPTPAACPDCEVSPEIVVAGGDALLPKPVPLKGRRP